MSAPSNPLANWLRPLAILLAGALVILAVLAAGLQFLVPTPTPPEAVELTDLDDLDQLTTRFNEDRGLTRLVLVLSPT